ncbi:MAG TPA: HD domain-containing protein [Acidimicrobiales bacterium]|nr:HD domain-containing protein [Acidimicrobiales bacterium]
MGSPEWARRHAGELLAPLGRRWEHSKAVAAKAADVADRLGLAERDVLVAAAYLHDIGYAPVLAVAAFHPLDGGRHLRELGEERLAVLVANHGGAAEEALLRELAAELAQFQREDSDVARVLDYCDLSVGPSGQAMTPEERLADVEARYGADHVVTRGLYLAWPRLMEEVAWVEARLAADQPR